LILTIFFKKKFFHQSRIDLAHCIFFFRHIQRDAAPGGAKGCDMSDTARKFETLNGMLERLRGARDIAPALEWCRAAAEQQLHGDGVGEPAAPSPVGPGGPGGPGATAGLEAALWRAHFVERARAGVPDAELVALVRSEAALRAHPVWLRELMGMLAFRAPEGPACSLGVYDTLPRFNAETLWDAARVALTAAYCAAHGLPAQSPLGACPQFFYYKKKQLLCIRVMHTGFGPPDFCCH
jgi:hypothetical protein